MVKAWCYRGALRAQRLLRLVPLMALWLAVLYASVQAAAAWAQASESWRIVVLHTDFVTREKFERLALIAAEANVVLDHLSVESASLPALEAALASASLVVADTPRPNDRATVEQRLAALPDAMSAPLLSVGGGRPAWERLSPHYAGPLAALYAAGGEANFRRFFSLTAAVQTSSPPAPELLAPPDTLPATGMYHPAADALFSDVEEYLAWQGHPPDDGAGRVAFFVHQGMISSMATDEIDTLVARVEAAGLVPIVFWLGENVQEGMAEVLAAANIDVLVNLSHMQNGTERQRDFLALDVPVIQTLRFREGEADDWLDAPSGVAPRTTAVFLAAPEVWGISDPIVLSAVEAGREVLLPAQVDALIGKLQHLVALRHLPAEDKRLALLFWNHPAGEKNLGASNLNVPRSVLSIRQALASAGYRMGEEVDEETLIATSQRLLSGFYNAVALDDLIADDLVGLYPLADYQRWLQTLPAAQQAAMREMGGAPEYHRMLRQIDGERYFVIPRWQLGNLLIMPQPPRHVDAQAHYHDTAMPPDHAYMASYLYLQQVYAAQALIHLGTHGTQEWLPGKDRGLAAHDYPWLAVGDIPVFYPYIQDNVGEAIQAKRRGRAVTVSHQTPSFAPAGLYDQLRDMHQRIHEYQQLDEGSVKARVANEIIQAARESHLSDDLGWSAARIDADFDTFLGELHDHLHELARVAMPLGLHTFGQPAAPEHRITTIMQQLGEPLYAALGIARDELYAGDAESLPDNPAYQAVERMLDDAAALPETLEALAPQAREYAQRLSDTQENEALLAGLAGRFVAPGAGGDPIRNPEAASGRNLYAFEADKLPTQAAYAAGEQAFDQLVDAFRAEHAGEWPQKLAFSLWSSEAIRHLGLSESQILHALGLKPVWDASGRVTALEIIPREELGRPRVDVVIQVTGVYRDQFDSFMRLLDDAMERLAQLDEPDNPIAANTQRITHALEAQGLAADEARRLAERRLFSNAPGAYGTGVTEMALRSTEWDDDGVLAEQFLTSSRYAYGAQGWGETPAEANLLAEQLRGTQAAIMSRSSNVHGVLSTDHPFEFLGGLSAAIRHLDGAAPQLLITDAREGVTTTGLARFLSDEMRARYLNPQWIGAMQAEGYAGTLEVLDATNNLFGWQVMDPSTVRDDQWQALFDTYVNDTRELGTNEWFETHNPTAQAQVLERMAEAIRKGYWEASEQTQQALAERFETLESEFDVATGAAVTREFIAELAQGFGLHASEPAPFEANAAPAEPSAARADASQTVEGQVLEAVEVGQQEDDARRWWAMALMLALVLLGSAWQAVIPLRRPERARD
ncbi:cobaltochelatase subunit CobN [Halomonas dongshanensis]|uniref:Cobaltochelatase subunit CobN n=1 Tax=Halomonas dongshanensis TaxID=2890835 RepID=A0ABT2EAF0_9GAMM|nr:cobaltochelatase subunit CobN [Halomonas dongshanensis]MCS2608541.1 cobaltochelatase subunit CobN [Halomonas dongshanensis]